MSGYPETYRPGLVVLGSEDQAVLIGIAGGREDTGLSLEDQLHEFVERMSSDIRDLAADDPLPADVQGLPALSAVASCVRHSPLLLPNIGSSGRSRAADGRTG